MAFQQLATATAGSVSKLSSKSYKLNTSSEYGYGWGSGASQATLEGIAGGKQPSGTPAIFGDVSYGFLDNFKGSGFTKINGTQGSVASQNWNLSKDESIYFSVVGTNSAKDYFEDFAWASVKYVGTNGSYNASLDPFSFDSKIVKVSTDLDWGTQEVVKFTAPIAGNYQLSLGITDAFDTSYNSQVTVSEASASTTGSVTTLDLPYLKLFGGITTGIVGSFNFNDIKTNVGTVTGLTLTQGGTGNYTYGSNTYWLSTGVSQLNKGGVSFDSDGITLTTASGNATDTEIEEFLGLNIGELDKTALQKNKSWGGATNAFYSNATAGAAYKQLVEVSGVGATIEFDYKWDGGDYLPYNDFAAVFVGSKSVLNENTDKATLYSNSGSSTTQATYNGASLNGAGLTDKSLASVYGAGDYADVVGKFKYTVKNTDSLYTIGGKKYVMLGVAITDVNDTVVDSSIKISNIKSNTSGGFAFSGFSAPTFSKPSDNIVTSAKQTAIAEQLAKVTTGGKTAANKAALSESLKGFDADLITGSKGIFNSSGISSSVVDTSIKTSLQNFDFGSLTSLIKSGNIGDLKIDASVQISFNANISSAALGLNTQVGGSVSLNTLVTAAGQSATTYNQTDWSKVNFAGATTETKKTLDWSKVQVGTGAKAVTSQNLSTTDYLQATVNGTTTKKYSETNWSNVKTSEFSSETLKNLDWSQVKFGDLTTESKQTLDWSKVNIGTGDKAVATEKLSTTDLLQTKIGKKETWDYKTTDWSKIEASQFSSETYNNLEWNKVNFNNMTSESKKSLDWNKVKIGDVSSEQKKFIDWSKVDINGASSEKLSTTDKLQIKINGNLAEDIDKTTDWSLVKFGEFSDETYSSTDWSKVKLNGATSESKKELKWGKVIAKDLKSEYITTTDALQVDAADGTITNEIKATDWKKLITAEFSTETYNALDWSKVSFNDKAGNAITSENKKTLNWKLVDSVEFGKSITKDTTDEFQWTMVNGSSKSQTNMLKKTNWSKLELGELSTETYSGINWGMVNMNGIKSEQYSDINWSKVDYKEFKTAQYKSTDWSKVDYGDFQAEDYAEVNWAEVNLSGKKSVNYDAVNWTNVFTTDNAGELAKSSFGSKVNWNKVDIGEWSSENYSAANWGVVNYKGMESKTYNTIDWGKVQFGEYKAASYATTDWAKVQTNEFTSETYKSLDWKKVALVGAKGILDAEGYTNLNFGIILDSGTFGKAEAKKVDWTKVDATDLDKTDIQKLTSYGVKTGTIGTKYVKPQQSPEAISFLGLQSAGSGATAAALNAGNTDAVVAALSGASVKKELQLV